MHAKHLGFGHHGQAVDVVHVALVGTSVVHRYRFIQSTSRELVGVRQDVLGHEVRDDYVRGPHVLVIIDAAAVIYDGREHGEHRERNIGVLAHIKFQL